MDINQQATSPLPIPLDEVLKEEVRTLRPTVVSFDSTDKPGAWNLTTAHLSESPTLEDRWKLLDFDKLLSVVAIDRPVWHLLKEKNYKHVLSKIMSYVGLQGIATPTEVCPDRLSQLNVLIKAHKCLYGYPEFPTERISESNKMLAKLPLDGIPKDKNAAIQNQRTSDREHVNRLLLEELFPDHIERIHDVRLRDVYSKIHSDKLELAALCLSGGGIRSATFALGVLQGLARKGILGKFDYLSTVSGGGYIGSWLSAWYHHQNNNTTHVNEELKCEKAKSPTKPEPKEIEHLRAYSNYLSPKLGLFSIDTWVLIGTYIRNLFLNWLVFIPALIAICALPRLYASILEVRPGLATMRWVFDAGLIAIIWAVGYATAAHPGRTELYEKIEMKDKQAREAVRFKGQQPFLWFCGLPLCLSGILLTTFWIWYYRDFHFGSSHYSTPLIHWSTDEGPNLWNYLVLGVAVHSVGWFSGLVWLFVRTKTFPPWRFPIFEAGSGAAGGFLLWVAAYLTYKYTHLHGPYFRILYSCLALPVFLTVFLFAAALFTGLCSYNRSDEDREWSARVTAWILVVLTTWMIFSTWIMIGPLLFYKSVAFAAIFSSIGGLSGIITLLLGHSGMTAANQKQKDKSASFFSTWALSLAAPLFFATIIAGVSFISAALINLVKTTTQLWSDNSFEIRSVVDSILMADGYRRITLHTSWQLAFALILVAVLLSILMSRLINLNKFSLHALYRNRLVRAYLGASNSHRKANHFTGFDPADNIPLSTLRSEASHNETFSNQKPLHVINMALNLVAGKNLAWQQRKAETFTTNKLYTGNFRLGYRKTSLYAKGKEDDGLTMGTAVTISGAAANSNMGYHSSPLVGFLMTLFNIRLGCWLGNPGPAGHDTYQEAAPSNPALYAAREALGLSDDASPFVFLSDGGHFENLGLYEMVLRRCKVIVVCDAGCDPDCSLEDLGNAIRKIRTDLGVNIDLKVFSIYSRNDQRYDKPSDEEIGKHCAIGTIHYKNVDDTETPGTLIYIKPTICGPEPKDIFNYKQSDPTFPHESTIDQFFSESQFESYRTLGTYTIERIFEGVTSNSLTLSDLEVAVRKYAETVGSGSQHQLAAHKNNTA